MSATNTGAMTRLSIILVAAVCALALPAAAAAQSAGDNQYQDPLANPHTGSNSGSKGSSGSGSSTPAAPSQGTSSGSGSSTSGTSGSSGAGTASSSGSSTASSLPRTGGHPELIALAG